MYILMTTELADQVRGQYGGNAWLSPIPFAGGYFLPASVLEAAEYAQVHEILKQCEIVDELPLGDENETI